MASIIVQKKILGKFLSPSENTIFRTFNAIKNEDALAHAPSQEGGNFFSLRARGPQASTFLVPKYVGRSSRELIRAYHQ
jgi:hypothetical protein